MASYNPDCHTADLAAAYVLESLLTACSEVLYDNYIEAKVIPMTLEMILGQLACGLEIVFQRRDVEEAEGWKGDQEPVPNPVDAWAVGRIAIRKVFRKEEELNTPVSLSRKLSKFSGSRKSSSVGSFSLPQLERPQIYTLEWALEKPDPITDQLRELKEKEQLQKQAEVERARILRLQREEDARRVDRMAFELKNSRFTYDYDGKILIVKPRPLPSRSLVSFSLKSIPEVPAKGKRVLTPRRPVQPIKKTPISELQFVKSLNTAPNVMDILKIAPGVVAFESNRSKRGPDVGVKTMTREEYHRIAAVDEGAAVLMQSENRKNKQSTLRRRVLSDIPDSDRDEEIPMYASLPTLVPEEQLSEVDKFNIQILKSQDWGLNIAALAPSGEGNIAIKPSPKMIQEAHGGKGKRPRDRPFIDRKLVREHLAPPRLGKTMGHGLSDPIFFP